jgi:hypothetical protein
MVHLRTHQKNIDRYEALLETKLTDAERRSLEKRLSEERLASWFTEGFDTLDLKQAKALLDELAS